MQKKLRNVGGCLVLTIPKQVCDLYGFHDGDEMIIEPIGFNELKLKKQEKTGV